MARGEQKSKKLPSKTGFVKSLPEDTPAKEVVERAKKLGLAIGERYVYVVRSIARRKAKESTNGSAEASLSAGTSKEQLFRRLVLDLGVDKVEQLLAEAKKGLAAFVAGK
jgi:hypothetical protein